MFCEWKYRPCQPGMRSITGRLFVSRKGIALGRLLLLQNEDRAKLVEDRLGHFPCGVPLELDSDAGNVGELEGGAALRIQFVIRLSGNADDERVLASKRDF